MQLCQYRCVDADKPFSRPLLLGAGRRHLRQILFSHRPPQAEPDSLGEPLGLGLGSRMKQATNRDVLWLGSIKTILWPPNSVAGRAVSAQPKFHNSSLISHFALFGHTSRGKCCYRRLRGAYRGGNKLNCLRPPDGVHRLGVNRLAS